MHARLSTVCNYEITPDPLYASIIIAFYASTGETTANFSVPRARARKVVLHFPSGCSLPFQLTMKERKKEKKRTCVCACVCMCVRVCVFIVVKLTSSFMLSLTRRHFSHITLPRSFVLFLVILCREYLVCTRNYRAAYSCCILLILYSHIIKKFNKN